MRISIAAWALLFAMSVATFFLWARLPRRPGDIEAYLLPAAFLLLAAWGQIMRLQAMLDRYEREVSGGPRTLLPNGGVGEFNRMFDKAKEKG
jgi:hypothetical protein